jgi:myosin I
MTRKVSTKENMDPVAEEPEPRARPQRSRSVRKVSDPVQAPAVAKVDVVEAETQPQTRTRKVSGPQAQGTMIPRKKAEAEVRVKEISSSEPEPQPRVAQMPAVRPGSRVASHSRKPSIRQVQNAEATASQPSSERQDAPHPQTSLPQIEPTPEAGIVPSTDPASVLARVSKFRDGIVQALENKGNTIRRTSRPVQLPYVTKWVDYSRKHGLGYVLEDGSIGCLMTSTSKHPVTAVVVREGIEHLRALGQDTSYLDKVPFEHYSCNNENGIKRIALERDRKRATGILWAKFGRYMCQQLGQADKAEPDSDRKRRHLVRFYQRLGDVVLWGFWDGSFQFNFPDHTKLVLSPHGNYCTFTCLTLDAVTYLQRHSTLPFRFIKDRQQISCSLVALLAGSRNDPSVEKTMQGNLLREKLNFVVELVDQWISGGGLGCKPDGESFIRWEGPRLEDGKKEEWVTVGRFGGDGERE